MVKCINVIRYINNCLMVVRMSASKACKSVGIKSLAHACRVADVPRITVYQWYRSKPKLFLVFIHGVKQVDSNG